MIRKWHVLWLGVATMALCFLLVEIIGRSAHTPASRIVAIVVLAVLVVAVVLVIAFALVASFQRRESPRKSIVTIAVAYATLVLSFASLYYVLAAVSDYDDAVAKVVEYGTKDSDPDDIPYHDMRAFKGINERLWSGVDWLPDVSNDREYSVREMRQAARRNEIVRFLPDERVAVFFQCLHLSIATITSTGYGDITPARPMARFLTDIEMLSGTTLLVVALGIVFSNFWERSEPRA